MNPYNNFKTLEHYQGRIWISKGLANERRGNVCFYRNQDFSCIAYISPDMFKKRTLEEIIHAVLKANGTLWMIRDNA